ncbi:hypothetical protein [Romboutsia timonensis]|uniref:hypothetical protein n=1 Tax=Romboutsia timonensis TaxID=1776391 RepID=UPI003994314B
MAMKKKFLPLLMAGMVVVGTTGLVNADTTTATVTGNDTQTLQSSVTVSGSVTTNQGTAPAGKITVELPTKMAFAVDKVGNLTGGTYTVKNSSKDAIDVYVAEFTKTSGNINVKENLDSGTSTRADVKLELTGNEDTVNLADSRLNTSADGIKVANIEGNNTGNITLAGEAGTVADSSGVDQNGASAEFNMVFKVKKA